MKNVFIALAAVLLIAPACARAENIGDVGQDDAGHYLIDIGSGWQILEQGMTNPLDQALEWQLIILDGQSTYAWVPRGGCQECQQKQRLQQSSCATGQCVPVQQTAQVREVRIEVVQQAQYQQRPPVQQYRQPPPMVRPAQVPQYRPQPVLRQQPPPPVQQYCPPPRPQQAPPQQYQPYCAQQQQAQARPYQQQAPQYNPYQQRPPVQQYRPAPVQQYRPQPYQYGRR